MNGITVNYDLFILFCVGVLFLLWEAATLLRFKGKVVVKGFMPSAKIAFAVAGVIFIWVFYQRFGLVWDSIVVMVLYMGVLLGAMFLNCGITERGVVIQGMLSRYERIRYYNIDVTTAINPRVRIGVGFSERFLEIPKEQAELVRAYFIKHKVLSFDEYVERKKAEAVKKDK